jgi:ubiquinone/menaquinone biosynthesis C-methylase UbiE
MARPTYPGAALASIFDKSTQSSPARLSIVEAGSGTGIFTRSMIQHLNLKNTLADILCVEPAAGMRLGFQNSSTAKELRSNLTLRVIDGTFDSIDVQDQSVDLVVIAQAFHWIGKDGSAAVQEIARILKPGGKFCCIWNLEDKETAWVGESVTSSRIETRRIEVQTN